MICVKIDFSYIEDPPDVIIDVYARNDVCNVVSVYRVGTILKISEKSTKIGAI